MFSLCLLFSVLCPLVRASELADLGQGLGYLRVKTLDDGLAALNTTNPLVLDLRQATTTTEAAARLNLLLVARKPADASLFILIGPDTPAKLAEVLKARSARTFLLGIETSVTAPDVVVAQNADDDRRAYEALDQGTPLTDLISGKVEKERFDEASLVEEFKQGNRDARPPEPPAATAPKSALPENPAERGVSGTNTGPAAAGSGALTDRVLQRAVHLHRALLALKR